MPQPEEILAAHRGERRLDARVNDVKVRQHVLGMARRTTDNSPGSILSGTRAVCAATCSEVGGMMLCFVVQCARREEMRTSLGNKNL